MPDPGPDPALLRKQQRAVNRARAMGILEGVCSALGPQSVCIDLGAHYGTITTRLAQTGAQVHAFEPDPHSFGVLSQACADYPNVTLHNAAVAVAEGEMQFFRTRDFAANAATASTGSTLYDTAPGVDPESAMRVRVIDFPRFLGDLLARHERIAFLKMDIEGAELEILEALVQTDMLERVNLTVVEPHGWRFPEWKPRFKALRRIARERPELRLMMNWM